MNNTQEKIVVQNNVKLVTQHFGKKENPSILLIAGATISMLYWDEEFCLMLAEKGFYVIRYDNRDVGKSTCYKPGTINYDLEDLADDAIHILDSYHIDKANIMGISLGGLIGQIIEIKYPDRVQNLILMSTGPWGTPDVGIPEMDDKIIQFQNNADTINWKDENEVVNYMLESSKLMSGSKPLDTNKEKVRIKQEFVRAQNYKSMFNHSMLQGAEAYYDRINEISSPTLIIHGTEDKIWNFGNTEKLKRDIKNSKLLVLEGTGHELNPLDWELITTEINHFINNK